MELRHKSILFADDASVVISEENKDLLESECNNIMDQLTLYLNKNLMYINTDKTKYISFNNYDLNIYFKNTTISRTENIKILGIIINQNLNFNDHGIYIAQKILKTSYLFRGQFSKNIPMSAKLLLYNSFTLSHITSSSIFLLNLNKTNYKILNKSFNAIYGNIFGSKNTYTLNNIIKKFANKFVSKVLTNKMPIITYDIFKNKLSNRKNIFILNIKPIKKLTFLYCLLKNYNELSTSRCSIVSTI